MRVEMMTEAGGAELYAAGEVRAGDVALTEVRRGGPRGVLIDALDQESRKELADALFERAARG